MRTFTNPIIENSEKFNTSDPYVLLHKGMYYHCYANKTGVYVAKSKTIEGIGNAEPKRVYAYSQDRVADFDWYAPELHYINNVWYIYGSPNMGNQCHTMAVLENKSQDPMQPFQNKGVVRGLKNKWTLDGTVLLYEGKYYLIWSNGMELVISLLVAPWEIADKGHIIGCLEYDFEKQNGEVMEGPAILKHDGQIFLVYSVNDSSTDDYALGIMTLKGTDPTRKESWQKHPQPVFLKTEGIFGPGHCCFTKVKEKTEWKDYIVYHANLQSGTGWNGRSVWAQEISYDEKGFPIFGKPQR